MTGEGLTGVARGRCVAVFAYGVGGVAPGGVTARPVCFVGLILSPGFKKKKKVIRRVNS